MQLLKRLDEIGFERTRRAVAALALSLFVTLYFLVSLNAPPGWGPAFVALCICYVVAFLGVAAEWFWARWFASGLGWSGVMVAIVSLVMIGWAPPLVIYGALHGLVVLMLIGKKMAMRYDLQEAWRERYKMDDLGVARLRKTVTRAAASLPSLILWALGPKEPGQGMLALLLAVAGLAAVVRMRSWGLIAMTASCVLLATVGGGLLSSSGAGVSLLGTSLFGLGPAFMALLLAAAVLPFVGPAARFLARRS